MTNIQTNLNPDELKELEEICKREKISKRKALRIAILDWIRRKKGFDPNDSFFTFKAGFADVQFGSGKVDALLYKNRDDNK
jgi:hypothetical protein